MVARFSRSFLSKTMDEMRFIKKLMPLNLKKDMGLGFVVGDGLDLHSLERTKRGSDRLHFPGAGFLLTIDDLELE